MQALEIRRQRPIAAATAASTRRGSSCRGTRGRRSARRRTPSTTRLISDTASSSSSAGSLRAASAAHMNVRVRPGRERQLGQHRLVELDEVGAGGRQLRELGPQQRHDVLGERLLRRVDGAASRSGTNIARVSRYGPGSVTFTGRSVCRRRTGDRRPPAAARRAIFPMQIGTADRVGRHVERLQQPLEPRLVLDDVEHLGQGHEADAGRASRPRTSRSCRAAARRRSRCRSRGSSCSRSSSSTAASATRSNSARSMRSRRNCRCASATFGGRGQLPTVVTGKSGSALTTARSARRSARRPRPRVSGPKPLGPARQPRLQPFEIHHLAVRRIVVAHREQRVEPAPLRGGIEILRGR